MKELRPSQISMIELFSKDSFQPLTMITKRSILDVAAALDPPLWRGPKYASD